MSHISFLWWFRETAAFGGLLYRETAAFGGLLYREMNPISSDYDYLTEEVFLGGFKFYWLWDVKDAFLGMLYTEKFLLFHALWSHREVAVKRCFAVQQNLLNLFP